MPESLNELTEWLRTPLRRFLRLKQRNWPAKTVQRSTRQLFNRLNHMICFFIQHYEWGECQQFSPRWLKDYIDTRLCEEIAPGTINWDLIYFRAFCQFNIDKGFDVPEPILKLKVLDTLRRLPRPLSGEQVCRLECSIQTAITEAKTDSKRVLTVRDLTCFYLLWHCGLRISEVCSLRLIDIDLEALAIGIVEGVQDDHLRIRVGQVQYLERLLIDWSIPIVQPVGNHEFFLDAKAFFPQIPQDQFPAQTLVAQLYLESGVRSMERGIVSAGRDPETGNIEKLISLLSSIILVINYEPK